MNGSRVISLVLVILLALPIGLFETAPERSSETGPTVSLASASAGPVASPADTDAPLFQKADKKKQADRKAGKKRNNDGQERKARDDRDKKPHAARKPGRSRNQAAAQAAPTQRELTAGLEAQCEAQGLIYLPKSGLCTHGPDPAPPGVDPTARARPVPAARASRVAAEAVCDGDGRSGPRVQVLYAHASDRPNRFATYLASFRTWTAETDSILRESAAAAGGNLRFRFVTEPGPGCAIDVQQVTLSPSGDDAFDNTIVELKAQGLTRTDRYYLVFVDTASAGICGIATGSGDDSLGQANWNNYGPGFSRVDAGCWGANAAAHELMHNLGAVNHSAPNTSLGGHCIDDYDIMCYSDPPHFPTMRIDCADFDLENLYDCGSDDYFNPNPSPGSYLDTHWNTANNRFLVGGGDGGDDDGAPPVITWISPAGNDGAHEAVSGTIPLEVTASDGSGINRVEFWRYDAAAEDWGKFATDHSPPYIESVDVADLDPGANFLGANVADGAREFAFEQVRIARTEPNPAPPQMSWTSPVGNNETHRVSSGAVALAVEATDVSGIDRVEFVRYDDEDEAWIDIATDASAPYTALLTVADLPLADNQVNARAFDTFGNRTSEPIFIERIQPPPPVAITSPQNGATFKPGAAVSIAVAVAEPAGATVEVRSCPGGSCSWAAGTSLGSDGSAPFGVSWTAPASGSVTFLAQVSAGAGPKLSEPVTVSIEETKAKKKKKKKKKKR